MRKIEEKFAKRRATKTKKTDLCIMELPKQNSVLEKPIVVDVPLRRANSFSIYGRGFGGIGLGQSKSVASEQIEDALTLDDSTHLRSMSKTVRDDSADY